MKVVSPEVMSKMDKATIEKIGIPGIALMENAGREVADTIINFWKQNNSNIKKVSIICGKGNNGGDGFVIARHLINNGFDVKVILLATADEVKGDAKINLNILKNINADIKYILNEDDIRNLSDYCQDSFAIVDAIFGTGLRGKVRGIASSVISIINSLNIPVIAVDIPSGVCGKTGKILGEAVKAHITVTMALPKAGLVLYPGAEYVGKLIIGDIGMSNDIKNKALGVGEIVEKENVRRYFKPYSQDSHKGTFGRVFVLAGSSGMSGAAYLTGMAAAKSGAGLVTVGTPSSLQDILAAKSTEIMTLGLCETKNRTLSTKALEKALDFAKKCDSVAIGPGLSQDKDTQRFVWEFIKNCKTPMVVDADAINALAKKPEILKDTLATVVITPHPGEMARLLLTSLQEIQEDRVKSVKCAAKEFSCTAVLKGAATLIATAHDKLYINPTGNPGMATGGSGDVLTGIIAALLARGMTTCEAAIAGVYIHGLAGDLSSRITGEISLVAGNLIDFLPGAFKKIIN